MCARIPQISIGEIKLPKNRRPLQAIDDLAASIEEIGLLNPVTATTKMKLVAGLHRLEACPMPDGPSATAIGKMPLD